jgi:DNA helicase HerA-like ATPase
MANTDNTILVIFGRKGSGKTELSRKIIREYPRVFAFDTLAEYDKGFKVCEGKQACIDAMLSVKDARSYRLSLRCIKLEDNLALMDLAYEFPRSLVVVEETSLYARPTFLPDEIAKLVRYGRHREIDQIYIARRPSEVHRDLTAQADLVISFEQREPRDVKYLRDVAGDAAERVQSLPKYKVLAFGDFEKMPIAVSEQLYRPGDRPPEKQIDAFTR